MQSEKNEKLKLALKAIEENLGAGTLAKLARVVYIKKDELDKQQSSVLSNVSTDIKAEIFAMINEKNDLYQLKLLLKKEIDVNIKNNEGQTPLIKAILLNSQSIVQLLIQHGADVNLKSNGITPLMLAAEKGLPYIAVTLIQANADIDAQATDGMSIAMMAAREGHADIVELLLSVFVNIKATTIKGVTALSTAQQFEHEEVVQLIEKRLKSCSQDA